MTLANYLYSLVYSDTYDVDKWQSWAENILMYAEFSDDTEWLFDAYLANSQEKLFDVIAKRQWEENYLNFNYYSLTEIIQGYYYEQFQNNIISLYDMLIKSGDVADAGQQGSLACEYFYNWASEIKKNSNRILSTDLMKKITDYFIPRHIAAMEQKRKLEAATLEDFKLES